MTDKRTEKHAETHACDLIDRQAVIDLLKQMRKDGDMVPWEGKDVFARIRKLPSAQPEEIALHESCTDCPLYDNDRHSCPRFNKVIPETLREVQPEQQWIPVTERLPEDSDYHDFWETPDGAVMWCKGTGEIGVGWYYESTKNWCDLWDNGVRDVIAWMPLPTPWEGGQDEQSN